MDGGREGGGDHVLAEWINFQEIRFMEANGIVGQEDILDCFHLQTELLRMQKLVGSDMRRQHMYVAGRLSLGHADLAHLISRCSSSNTFKRSHIYIM